MKPFCFLSLCLFWIQICNTQITCTPEDTLRFHQKIEQLKGLEANSLGDSIVYIGKAFLDTPYVEKTLEVGQTETLVINLRGLDCTTFVENVLAFTALKREGKGQFDAFANTLKTIRYRNGELQGYGSRLHYFTDWIRNNEKKGLVKNISNQLGGEVLQKPINFMGTHRELYPFLKDDSNYQSILSTEAALAQEPLCIVSQDQLAVVEDELQNGDIIALATSIKGLDVTHTGFAIRMPSGRIHLLHASISGAVTITENPLTEYLKKIKSNIGIVVARPL